MPRTVLQLLRFLIRASAQFVGETSVLLIYSLEVLVVINIYRYYILI